MVKQCQRDDSMVVSVDQTIDVQEPAGAHSHSGPSVGALEQRSFGGLESIGDKRSNNQTEADLTQHSVAIHSRPLTRTDPSIL